MPQASPQLERYRPWKVRPCTSPDISRDREFREMFIETLEGRNRKFPLRGYARALELYGCEQAILECEHGSIFAQYMNRNSRRMKRLRDCVMSEGLNPFDGFVDRKTWTYYWSPSESPEAWVDAPVYLKGRSSQRTDEDWPDPWNIRRVAKELEASRHGDDHLYVKSESQSEDSDDSETPTDTASDIQIATPRSEETTQGSESSNASSSDVMADVSVSSQNNRVNVTMTSEEIAFVAVEALEHFYEERGITERQFDDIKSFLDKIGGSAGTRKTLLAADKARSTRWKLGACLQRIRPGDEDDSAENPSPAGSQPSRKRRRI